MKQYLFIGITILAVASARVTREVPKEDGFMDKVETGLQDVQKLVQDLTGAANTDELKEKVDKHIEVVVNQFTTWTNKLKEETDHVKDNEMVKELRQTIDNGVEELKQHVDKHIAKFKEEQPETFNHISQHVETVKSTSSAIASKIEELANSEDAKNLKETSLKFIDEIKNSLMNMIPETKEGEKKD